MGCKRCCRVFLTIVGLAIFAIVGGILIWKFLPQERKAALGTSLINSDEPEYIFARCDQTNKTDCCNGLDGICDLHLDEVMYAGSHNTMATSEDGFLIAPNHDLTLSKALDAGYRAINLDVGKCSGNIVMVHGRCELGVRESEVVFEEILSFLDENPTEILLISLQLEDTDGERGREKMTLEDLTEMVNNTPGLPEKLYTHVDRSQQWPTLRTLRDTGKQIVLFYYNGEKLCFRTSCPEGIHDWFLYAEETEYSFRSVVDVDHTQRSCAVTRGSTRATIFAINMFVTLPSRAASETLNSLAYLEKHVRACEISNLNRPANVVFVDFWSRGNLPFYVQQRNRERGAALLSEQRRRAGKSLRGN